MGVPSCNEFYVNVKGQYPLGIETKSAEEVGHSRKIRDAKCDVAYTDKVGVGRKD